MGFFDTPQGQYALADILGSGVGGGSAPPPGGPGGYYDRDPAQIIRALQERQQAADRANPGMAPQGFGEDPRRPPPPPPVQPLEDTAPRGRSEILAPAGSDMRSQPPWPPAQSYGDDPRIPPSTVGMASSPQPSSFFRPGSFLDQQFGGGGAQSGAEPNEVWSGGQPQQQASGAPQMLRPGSFLDQLINGGGGPGASSAAASPAANGAPIPPQMASGTSDITSPMVGGDPRWARPPLAYGPDSGPLPPDAPVPLPRPRPANTANAPMNIVPAGAAGTAAQPVPGGSTAVPSDRDREGMAGYAPGSAALMQPGGAPLPAGAAGSGLANAVGAGTAQPAPRAAMAAAPGRGPSGTSRFMAGLGAGLSNVGKMYPHGALGAFAGGAGAGIQGSEARGDKDFDQSLKGKADSRADAKQAWDKSTDTVKLQIAQRNSDALNTYRQALGDRAQATGTAQGFANAFRNTPFFQRMKLEDLVQREAATKSRTLDSARYSMKPEDFVKAKDDLNKEIAARREELYKENKIDKDEYKRGTEELPHETTNWTSDKFAYLPHGQWYKYKNPQTGKEEVLQRNWKKNPPPGYNPDGGGQAGQPPTWTENQLATE